MCMQQLLHLLLIGAVSSHVDPVCRQAPLYYGETMDQVKNHAVSLRQDFSTQQGNISWWAEAAFGRYARFE